jgi:hypothetical protein
VRQWRHRLLPASKKKALLSKPPLVVPAKPAAHRLARIGAALSSRARLVGQPEQI